ncbi:MAG: hypothetical protein KY397_07230, partial [Gemmatimonadetes bacterium]|nr:hypothetical protein [Gemmatimonadota bacterium]
IDPQAQNALVEELTTALSGREERIQELVADLASLSDAVVANEPEVRALISNANTLLATYNAREDQLTALLGGRAAEILVLKETTTGAGDDLQRATDLARRMVTKWGMSEALGPLTYGDEQEQVFLGREIAQHRDYSEETARVIDKEVKGIVSNAFDRAIGVLRENEETLHRMADALLEREILDREELQKIIEGKALPPEEEEEAASTGPPEEEPAEEAETIGAALGVDDSARDPEHPTPEPAEEGAERSSGAKPDREGRRSREPVARADDGAADESPLPSDT